MTPDQTMTTHELHHEHEHSNRASRLEAVEDAEVSELARHADPSARAAKSADAVKEKPGHGVEWVRPSDLMTRASSHVAGRGIDFQAELARRARGLTADGARTAGRGAKNASRALSERARRLPPASAFGRGPGLKHFSWVSRSGIGLG